MDINSQDLIAAAIRFEDEQGEFSEFPSVSGWIFSGPRDWFENSKFKFSAKFTNAIQGKKITAPTLSQRSDFEKIATSILLSYSSQHTLSPVALRILQSNNWTGNFSQLKKVIRLAISQATGSVIRQEIKKVMQTFNEDAFQPCTHCNDSAVRAETCIMIQRTWAETGGNVSLVARRLGISRNTVYKHVR